MEELPDEALGTTEEDIQEFETIPSVIEVNAPDAADFPEKVQQVLCLMACGFSPASIARLSKVTPNAIRSTLDRYDPDRRFSMTHAERQKFLARLWEARAGEALLHITPAKLEKSSAAALARVASVASEQMLKAAPKDAGGNKNPDDILESLGR